jgi:hypothetical protein
MSQVTTQTAWIVACAFLVGSWEGRPAWAQEPPRGDLKIEGTRISKVILVGGDNHHTEELTDPCGTVRVPVGTYRVQQVELRGGYASLGSTLAGVKGIAVTEDTPAALKVGGPLRQEVKVTRQGQMLILNHELLGVGGERYLDSSRQKPPQFAIYKGDKMITSSQFAYG